MLQTYIKNTDKKLAELESQIEKNECYSYRHNLLIFGIHENRNENCEQVFMKLVADSSLNCVQMSTFQRAHRLGKQRINANKPRPLIIRFVNLRDKSEFTRQFIRHHRTTNFVHMKNIFLKDHLTSNRLNLFNSCLSLKRSNSRIMSVFTRDCTIHVKYGTEESNRLIIVNNESDLKSIT